MKILKHILASGAILLVVATTSLALANPPIGSRIDRSGPGLTGKHNPRHNASARPAVHAYLKCTAALERAKAVKLLDQKFRSPEQIAMADDFVPLYVHSDSRRPDCFSNFGDVRIGYDPVTLIGALAEFLVIDRYVTADIQEIATLSSEEVNLPELMPRNASEMVGMCVARARGDLIFNLIQSDPDSADEKKAISELVPLLSPCLTKGVEVQFNASSLRSFLAYGLYRTLSQMRQLRKAS